MAEKRIVRGNRRQTRAYVGLGSNIGDRIGFIQQAMQFLKDIQRIKVLECSSLYETEPVGNEYTEWFVNAVAAVATDLGPEELLDVLKDIESRLDELNKANKLKCANGGRTRIIDLDILFFGDQIVDTDYLKVPHPNVDQRAYALVPMLEIAPEFTHPRLNKTIAQLHEDLPAPELVYLYGTRTRVDED